MDTSARRLDTPADTLSESVPVQSEVGHEQCLWMASTETLYWGTPRWVCMRILLNGPDPKRQYVLISVESPPTEPDPDHPTPRDVVLTPRHQHEVTWPEPGRPLRVHLWAVNPATDIIGRVFQPPRPQADGWAELWCSYEEAEHNGAKPWW